MMLELYDCICSGDSYTVRMRTIIHAGRQCCIAALFCTLAYGTGTEADLEQLIARIPRNAGSLSGVGLEEQQLADAIQAFGSAAVPSMIRLLSDENRGVRLFAGYVLRDLPGTTEEHLDLLIAACKAGDRWISPAIGRIGSPRAVAFLVEELKRRPQRGQVSFALLKAGQPAAVAIAQLFSIEETMEAALFRVICSILFDMGEVAQSAIFPLLAVAENLDANPHNRAHAVIAVGFVGRSAADAIPRLEELAKQEPEMFRAAADSAVIRIGTPAAAEVLVRHLASDPSVFLLRDLANLGIGGRRAGPLLIELLEHRDREIRATAASALGYIDYSEATNRLIEVLSDQDDWRLVFTATRSLGRLRARAALSKLQSIAGAHWYPPVRDAAARAIRAIGELETNESDSTNFASEFFEYKMVQVASNRATAEEREPQWQVEPDVVARARLLQHPYEAQIEGLGEDGREVLKQSQTPRCGLRVPNGILLGGDRGEWGGELVYLRNDKSLVPLISENTIGIHRLGDEVVAVTGLAHGVGNSGSLHVVDLRNDAEPVTHLWKVLPGAPFYSRMLASGELYVACVGGDIAVGFTGKIRMAPFDYQEAWSDEISSR